MSGKKSVPEIWAQKTRKMGYGRWLISRERKEISKINFHQKEETETNTASGHR